MRRGTLAVLATAVLVLQATAARADDDEWTRRVKQGMHQENREKQGGLSEGEVDKLDSLRMKTRFFAHAAVGYASLDDHAAPDFQLGGGLRLGLSPVWGFQARASLEYLSASTCAYVTSTGPSTSTSYICGTKDFFGVSAEGTFRLSFGRYSPIYAGLGPRLGILSDNPHRPGSAVGLAQAVLEFGGTFGPDDKLDVGLRSFAGMVTAHGDHPVVMVVGAFGYAFN